MTEADRRSEAFLLSGYIATLVDGAKNRLPRVIEFAYPIRPESEETTEPARVHVRTALGHEFEISIRPLAGR